MTGIDLRPLDLTEIETLLSWAKAEGWNPGLADAAAFHATDPDGFIGCFIDGAMAAGISAVRYGDDLGFIGLYIAHPDYRGKGLGRRVWDAGMARLAGRTVGLDGVPEQQANYRSMGFELDYDTFRWSGKTAGRTDTDIHAFDETMLEAIITFDRQHFPAGRETFLQKWLEPPRVVKTLLRHGEVKGYAVARRCHEGFKIGPLFATDAADAMALIAACANEAGGQPFHIDVPITQSVFAEFLLNAGFSKSFRTSRMYLGPAPSIDLTGVFGVTTLELG